MTNDISFTRGDTHSIKVTVPKRQFLATDVVQMTVRKSIGGAILLHKYATINDGVAYFSIAHDDTKDIPFGSYVFDVELTYDNNVATVVKGRFELTWEATEDD